MSPSFPAFYPTPSTSPPPPTTPNPRGHVSPSENHQDLVILLDPRNPGLQIPFSGLAAAMTTSCIYPASKGSLAEWSKAIEYVKSHRQIKQQLLTLHSSKSILFGGTKISVLQNTLQSIGLTGTIQKLWGCRYRI
ncbi:hypothetical protein CBS147332_5582 [Penicillium roqueforti]|nr:hypothetical protein CBS147332_5582 [Penicillium roqueforti]KAI3107859.1 hypothetical protein CBS147331_5960 [Penicillium roqueforti]